MRRSILLILAGMTTMILLALAFTLLADASPAAPSHWSASYNISNSTGVASRPRIVADINYYLHLIWVDDRNGNEDIYYTKSTNSGTSWSASEPITTTAFLSSASDLAAGPDGSVHSAWLEILGTKSHGLEYAARPNGGGWNISTAAAPAFQLDPAIAVDGTYIYLAWWKRLTDQQNPNIYYLRRAITDTDWLEPQLITDTVDGSITPDAAIDSDGNMHVAWQEEVSGGAIWYSKGQWDAGGGVSWSPVINLSQGLTNCTTPAIATGGDNYVHVVWGQRISKDEQYVYYTNFPANDPGSMLSPIKIFVDGLGVSETAPSFLYPRLAVEGTNTVHIVWHGKRLTDVTDEIWYSISENKGANWSAPFNISRDPTSQSVSPDIAIDENLVHVVWQGKDANGRFQVMYSRGFPSVAYLPLALKAH